MTKAYKGEVWEVFRVNYEKNCFEKVGELYFDYKECTAWLEGKTDLKGWTKEWLRRFAKQHNLQGETLVRTLKEYVR